MRGVLSLREAAVSEDLGEGHVGARRLRKPAKLYGQMGTDEGTSQADEVKKILSTSIIIVEGRVGSGVRERKFGKIQFCM